MAGKVHMCLFNLVFLRDSKWNFKPTEFRFDHDLIFIEHKISFQIRYVVLNNVYFVLINVH